ncbi:LAME_0F13608g1_1 [Lachancea meyersii CBS 8951]|uniref:LAME_0F13608g1_1 n=1 Tax=Lachancea meyersii CBS 8951 TaxID=1266667 RepID=A0A1G4JXE5_9SACH|nr:LAME_0F13608g1_1 [Lachancea meyersii CBS 8951]
MSEALEELEYTTKDVKDVKSHLGSEGEKSAPAKRSRSLDDVKNVDEASTAKKVKNEDKKIEVSGSGDFETAQNDEVPVREEKDEKLKKNEASKTNETRKQSLSPENEETDKKGPSNVIKERESVTESKSKQEEKQTPEAPKSEVKPKFTFGASSSFSSGFGVAKKAYQDKNVQKVQDEKHNSETSTCEAPQSAPKPAVFGSGFAFGAGFCALNKGNTTSSPKVFENEAEKAEKAKSSNSTPTVSRSDEKSSSAESDGVVKLTKQEVKSGEESEESIFQANAKLYQLSDLKDGWKERGVGAIHVNTDRRTGKGRIVMRSRGILKVILNVSLVKGVIVHKGFPASLHGEKFIRIVTIDHEKTPVQYALRTGKEETATEMYDHISKLIPSS